ncbi:drug/metabolite transporter (DMT)-like permease [Microvirga flocculans]|uniref:Drug/metabolite transporter (DMT)-like permease n=1 Tax=Microvirga flocculans TaxID=217168 RepID=A0A7W6IG33_9HYPH|nr:DMT family transporter [Microvirga flocculans]MBB4040674.1 drug/metabolite transporter (DMT)-like permease [Microvirga flocculans]
MTTAPSVSHRPFLPSRSEAVLIFITMIWGATFLIVQNALAVSGPLLFVGLRFGTAALMMALIALPVLRGLTWAEIKAGVMIGVAIFLGYTLQTYGLQTIPSSKSAFITALYVPIVPLLQWLALKRPPGIMSWIGIALAFTGLVLLAGPDGASLGLGVGEFLTLLSAIAIAAEIILIGGFAGRVDVRRVTVVQLAVTSLLAFGFMAPLNETMPEPSWLLLLSAVGLGLASAGIQLAMNWAQRTVSPTRATVIYAGEPVWAGIVGRVYGEHLPVAALAGAALIVAGVIVSELKPRRWLKARPSASA